MGGSRAGAGRPPDPNALRRDRKTDSVEWVDLPAAGRAGAPPAWPLPDQPSATVLELWAVEWRRPQAVEWARQGQELEVALYLRALVIAESPGASAADRNVVARMMSSLGLTTTGMRANRWRIVDGSTPTPERKRAPRAKSARDRLKVVQGGETGAGNDGGRA